MFALKLNKHKTEKKKKKKDGAKTKKFKGNGLRIVDDEDSFGFGYNAKKHKQNNHGDSDDQGAEELPTIAAVVDERPKEVQMQEEFEKGKWKKFESSFAEGPSSSFSSVLKSRPDSDDDPSPPRISRIQDLDDDPSPPRRRRHDSDDDLSPPRRKRHDSDEDPSPPRRKRHDSDEDPSPPRRNRKRDSDDDLSPPRRNPRNSNRSPSPSVRNGRPSKSAVEKDASPPRRPAQRSRDIRRHIVRPEILDAGSTGDQSATTLEGKKAGLQRAADLRHEMVDYRKRENEMFANLNDEVSGRTAKTKLRDKRTGRERDLMAELAKKEEEDKIAEEKKKQYDKWGKGLKQVEEQSSRLNEALHEVSKPLARYADDEDLDHYLKGQDREGDPMLQFLSSKKKKLNDKPRYSGPPPPPNRFGIPPGYRWDGVDRSGGYEHEWFSRINAKKAIQDEAYKWSVEDL